jgi:flagellar motility protein MotE (MotC chaperone)
MKKEKEYKKQKLELKKILTQTQNEKKEIEDLFNRNKEILEDIEGAVGSKTSKIYNSMKPKRAAEIFDRLIEDGKIEDVFDIILKLKEKKVTLVLKFLSVENAATLTQMLENYSIE